LWISRSRGALGLALGSRIFARSLAITSGRQPGSSLIGTV
jgi:hypothetical protein